MYFQTIYPRTDIISSVHNGSTYTNNETITATFADNTLISVSDNQAETTAKLRTQSCQKKTKKKKTKRTTKWKIKLIKAKYVHVTFVGY